MRTTKLYNNGLTVGTAPMASPRNALKTPRGKSLGWSVTATRNNLKFLRSVDTYQLSGIGFAYTLTLRNCPPSAEAFHSLRTSFIKRMRRLGFIRHHWVVEWQRRGVPHLHGVIYFPSDNIPSLGYANLIIQHWLDITCDDYGTTFYAQHVSPVTSSVGWLQYLAKHSARGATHYQRDSENMPQEWKSPGRVWGYGGEWPVEAPIDVTLSNRGFYLLRRLMRSWRIADARSDHPDARGRRISSARRMLKCSDPKFSNVRGASEWIPREVSEMLVWLAASSTQI